MRNPLLCMCFLFLTSLAVEANELTADQIFDRVEENNKVPSEETQLVMTITEPDGTRRDREVVIRKKDGKEQRVLLKIKSPTDLKGVGLLTVKEKGGEEDQWLYLPTEKKSRRIIGSGKKKKFLDSELTYEDMRPSTYKNFSNKVLRKEKNGAVTVIESLPKKGHDTSYSKIITEVYMKTFLILKVDYYGESGDLIKTMALDKYKRFKNVWRARTTVVKNVKRNRGTILEMKKFTPMKLSDGEFTMSALEE